MTRVLTRAILLTAAGGLALAPAIASAADAGPETAPPATTVTQLTTPKDPQAGEMFTLSAKVSPEDPATTTGTSSQAGHAKKPGGDAQGATKGKGKTKGGKGGGTTHKHAAETGKVTFTVDGKAQMPVELVRDHASEKLDLAAGKHTVTASYSGDQNYTASQSAPLTFTVG